MSAMASRRPKGAHEQKKYHRGRKEANYADQIFPEQLQLKYPDHILSSPPHSPLQQKIFIRLDKYSACVCIDKTEADGGGGKSPPPPGGPLPLPIDEMDLDGSCQSRPIGRKSANYHFIIDELKNWA